MTMQRDAMPLDDAQFVAPVLPIIALSAVANTDRRQCYNGGVMHARSSFAAVWVAIFITIGVAALLAALPRPATVLAIAAGEEGPFVAEGETAALRNFFGFHGAEPATRGMLRWTTGEASFLVRNGYHFGRPLFVELRLCGCRGDAPVIPVQLRVSGEPLAVLPLDGRWDSWRTYRVLLPPRTPAYAPDLLLELLSEHVPHPEFNRRMGVAYGGVQLGSLGPQAAYPGMQALLLALCAAAAAAVFLWRRSLRSGIAAAAAILLLVLLQGFFYQPHPLPLVVPALGLATAVVIAWVIEHRPATLGLLIFFLVVPVLLVQVLGAWVIDDAFISFRYALNALHVQGFVFNPGERVEGYTNFLWVALFVPILAAGLPPATTAQALTLLCSQLIVALVWWAARRRYGVPAAAGAVLLLLASTPFILWTARGSGMETALFSLLLLAGIVACLERRLLPAGMLLGLAAMTRPEGVLAAAVCSVVLAAPMLRAALQRMPIRQLAAARDWRAPLRLLIGFGVIFLPYYLWRFSYYGYPLPNTFYAKVGATEAQAWRGLHYAAEFAASQWPLLLLLLVGSLAWLMARRSYSPWHAPRSYTARDLPPAMLPALLCGLYGSYIIAVGGDHFPLFRFFVPLLPLLALLCAAALAQIPQRLPQPLAAGVGVVLVAVGIIWQVPQQYTARILNAATGVWGEQSVVDKNREIGLWLRANTPPDTLVATGIAGALAYYSERPILDTLGLNDLHIAHMEVATMGQGIAGSEKFDREYVLDRQPAYVPYSSADGLRGHAPFDAAYERITVRGPEGRGVRLYVHVATAGVSEAQP